MDIAKLKFDTRDGKTVLLAEDGLPVPYRDWVNIMHSVNLSYIEIKRVSRKIRTVKVSHVQYKDGKLVISDDHMKILQQTFPSIDIPNQLTRMEKWLKVNAPKKNHERFVFNWLNNCKPASNNNLQPMPGERFYERLSEF